MKSIIVLGMHRSATSMTARSIHQNKEVYMGEKLLLGHADNPKGHYEDVNFLKLNIKILNAVKGDWKRPPSRESILKVGHLFDEEIKELIKKSENKAKSLGMISWGFKDPRTILTIDLYMKHLKNPQFICCYRNHLDVAKSLHKRDGIPLKDGIQLSKIYNNRLSMFMQNWLNK